ncbi:NADH:flavin oxidoreductase [Pseudomonas taiwanensis]|uniref:NADH:flavin oxidoreductase n=1 Tax=Pseudomonas taiwanensis TaxID=470150 RepID=A0ABR6VCA6_9PSED|nr:NADH:flavin oxidoreductase [Pseudomonas taiwanensis]MBC3478029.1 NADH:flavin oxidoreductase [Pseudomonas taiwanensis]
MTTISQEILSDYIIGNVPLSNRLAVAPMSRVSATVEGNATEAMARYYERFAKGGFGLVISEGVYTDQKHSTAYHYQPGISDEEQARSWRSVTDRIHTHQSAVFAQIMHAGALTHGSRFGNGPIAPSAVTPKGEKLKQYYGEGSFPTPKVMTEEDIADAIAGFARSAALSLNLAGFDGIEIHGANGYLLDQFLTNYSNTRTDRWGGSLKKRMELIIEVVHAVKAVSSCAPVGVRISQGKVNDFNHKWPEGEAAAETIFGTLKDLQVDFIHVTDHKALMPAFPNGSSSLLSLAKKFASGTTIITNGDLGSLTHAAQARELGGDIIAIGKAALSNPDLPRKWRSNIEPVDFDPTILQPIANIKNHETHFS